jgi:hypothetical protein
LSHSRHVSEKHRPFPKCLSSCAFLDRRIPSNKPYSLIQVLVKGSDTTKVGVNTSVVNWINILRIMPHLLLVGALALSATANHSEWQTAFDSGIASADLEAAAAEDRVRWSLASPKETHAKEDHHEGATADSHAAKPATDAHTAKSATDAHAKSTGHGAKSHAEDHHPGDHHAHRAGSKDFPGGQIYFYILLFLGFGALVASGILKSALLSTFALFVGSMTLAHLALTGVGGEMFWSPTGRFAGSAPSLLVSLTSVWLIAFAKQYYSEQVKPLSSEEGFFNFLLGLNLFLFVAFALSPESLSLAGAKWVGGFNALMLIGLSAKLAIGGDRSGYPFSFALIAYAGFHGLYLTSVMGAAGLILASVLTLVGMIAGAIPIQMALMNDPSVDLKKVDSKRMDEPASGAKAEPSTDAHHEPSTNAPHEPKPDPAAELAAEIGPPPSEFDDSPPPSMARTEESEPSSAMQAPGEAAASEPVAEIAETESWDDTDAAPSPSLAKAPTRTSGWVGQVSGLLDQVIFKVDQNFEMEVVESPLIEWWFGVEELNFDWLNKKWSAEVEEENALKESLLKVFHEPEAADIELNSFPEVMEFGDRKIGCKYQVVVEKSRIVAVAFGMTNVTELSEVQEQLEVSKDLNRMLVRAVLQREDFATFVNGSLGKFAAAIKHLKSAGDSPDLQMLTDTFRSVQSGADVYSMTKVSRLLQEMLDQVDMAQNGPVGMDADALAEMLKNIAAVWAQFKGDVQRLHDSLGFDLTESQKSAA